MKCRWMPPIASTMFCRPGKFASTKSLIGMWKSCRIVCTSRAGPLLKAALILFWPDMYSMFPGIVTM